VTEPSHHFTPLGDLTLHYVAAGAGAPVVLLHGFPEFWYSWRRQLTALATAGLRAIAPDLPGYNESDKPQTVKRCRVRALVADVARFIENVAGGPAVVVGHDWGGLLAWRLAATYPALVKKLAILNAPHPAAYRETLRRDPAQWFRSAYVFFFQLPALPEALIRAGDFTLLERAWRSQPVHRGAFTESDVVRYKEALRRPGALTATLNYYRAALRFSRDIYGSPQQVRVPTLVIWGERDPYLGVRLLEGLPRWVPDLCIERIPHASHWVQNDVPERVNQLLIDFVIRSA
jgi:pimeloyl-ACP methyl ester carboxylesterase